MKAQEAYKIALNKQEGSLQVIYDHIQEAAENKKFETTLPYILVKVLRDRLKADGFAVTISDRYGGTTQINWWCMGVEPIDNEE